MGLLLALPGIFHFFRPNLTVDRSSTSRRKLHKSGFHPSKCTAVAAAMKMPATPSSCITAVATFVAPVLITVCCLCCQSLEEFLLSLSIRV